MYEYYCLVNFTDNWDFFGNVRGSSNKCNIFYHQKVKQKKIKLTWSVLQLEVCLIGETYSSLGELFKLLKEVFLQVISEAIRFILLQLGLFVALSVYVSDSLLCRGGLDKNPNGVKDGLLLPQVDGVLAWISWFNSLCVCFFLQ